MHKKVIGSSEYYYTTYRTNDGEHRTHYLGKDFDAARRKEAELLRGLRPRSYKNLYLLLTALFGLTLVSLSGQTTGFFSYEPASMIEFDINASWNMSEALVRISIGNYSTDLAAADLVTGGRIAVDAQALQLNMTGRLYADLIVSNELVESRYIDITGNVNRPNIEYLREEVRSRLGYENIEVEEEAGRYTVTIDTGPEKEGAVILQVGNVSDIKKVQIVRLEENVIQL